jgi:hypothetical protein
MQTSIKTHLLSMLNAGIAYEKKQAAQEWHVSKNPAKAAEHDKRRSLLSQASARIEASKFSKH